MLCLKIRPLAPMCHSCLLPPISKDSSSLYRAFHHSAKTLPWNTQPAKCILTLHSLYECSDFHTHFWTLFPLTSKILVVLRLLLPTTRFVLLCSQQTWMCPQERRSLLFSPHPRLSLPPRIKSRGSDLRQS